jgi:hypothetical protein
MAMKPITRKPRNGTPECVRASAPSCAVPSSVDPGIHPIADIHARERIRVDFFRDVEPARRLQIDDVEDALAFAIVDPLARDIGMNRVPEAESNEIRRGRDREHDRGRRCRRVGSPRATR